MHIVHVALIVAHAAVATVAFALGLILVARLPSSTRSVRFQVYVLCVWVGVVALIGVVVLDWGALDPGRRIAFPVFCALGVYLLWRTERARAQLASRPSGWRRRFIGHVGFVLISLFDGFCIVLAIDLGLPFWVITLIALAGVAVGILALRARVRREVRDDATPA
jgi:hypothetical protein